MSDNVKHIDNISDGLEIFDILIIMQIIFEMNAIIDKV